MRIGWMGRVGGLRGVRLSGWLLGAPLAAALALGGAPGAAQELLAPQEPPPQPLPSHDEGATVVGVWVEYETQGQTVRDIVEEDEPMARACFDSSFPAETRAQGRYEVCLWVQNPNRDPDAWGAQDVLGCVNVDDHPVFERCLREAFPSYPAPPDVTSVALHVTVDTNARGLGGIGYLPAGSR